MAKVVKMMENKHGHLVPQKTLVAQSKVEATKITKAAKIEKQAIKAARKVKIKTEPVGEMPLKRQIKALMEVRKLMEVQIQPKLDSELNAATTSLQGLALIQAGLNKKAIELYFDNHPIQAEVIKFLTEVGFTIN